MTDINKIDLRLIDTTILLVFLETMRHRKATVVAREMGLTQPAVSHALKRLRSIYGDPLFLRRAHGLEPTSFAKELEPKVRKIIRLLSETLDAPDRFEPHTAVSDLRIGAFDYELTGIIPKLVASLRKDSPGINVHALPFHNAEALDALVNNRIDLAIGYFDFPPRSDRTFVAETLYLENYVLTCRRDHPLMSEKLTMPRIAAANHLLLSPSGMMRDMLDQALHLQGFKRNIRTIVPSLFAALSIVESSDLVVILPRRVAMRNLDRFKIATKTLPLDEGNFKLHAVRHVRDTNNPLHNWLGKKLRQVVFEAIADEH